MIKVGKVIATEVATESLQKLLKSVPKKLYPTKPFSKAPVKSDVLRTMWFQISTPQVIRINQ